VSEHLEVSLLYQWAQVTYKPNMGPRKKPRAHGRKKKASGLAPSPHLIRHHSPRDTIQSQLRDSPGRQ